ncbi:MULTISPECIES: transcriptional regulator PtsJ [unclassified Duganella]|uniref:MocR-like B6 salvage transcription factor PtsJ n=1 Tax=unclassified Duganella TaxID=2636909 RepID=UPI00087FE503|nr:MULTISPECIES: transcriptional regulator PtsJ [unclassified Duganella]SDG35884.1 DNA-binding transcriptional regulator, MocR family, contains an aminotransferase domain [Duganella sp. OV458]SDJ67543.1 transcriptional regulator, GntR family [Duganella sp. OV510]
MISGSTAIDIADSIRALVQDGHYQPGDALPPVRELAETLGVNRNTVAAAYQRLTKAGIAVSQGRLGTTIRMPQRAGEQEGLSADTPLADVAHGNPNADWLPDIAPLLAGRPLKRYVYGEDTILPELRDWAHAWFTPDCPAKWELELTNGAVDAIERLAVAQLVPGDKVAVEDPAFLGTINALRLSGMQAVGVPIDDEGMQPQALARALEDGARAVLLTPRSNNPTGCSLSKRRADELKRVLAVHPNVLVIVDDHFALLADTPYHNVIPAATARWALVRSVSKALGPDLRLAFVACDADTAARLRTRLAPGMTWVSRILQAMVAACLASEPVHRQVEAARIAYAARRDALHQALRAQGIVLPRPSGGLNVWIPVTRDARDVAYAMAKKGWLVRLGSAYDVQAQSQAIRITISHLEETQARQLALDLKSCL